MPRKEKRSTLGSSSSVISRPIPRNLYSTFNDSSPSLSTPRPLSSVKSVGSTPKCPSSCTHESSTFASLDYLSSRDITASSSLPHSSSLTSLNVTTGSPSFSPSPSPSGNRRTRTTFGDVPHSGFNAADELILDSPQVLDSPEFSSVNVASKRRSTQTNDQGVINWARPSPSSAQSSPSSYIFGISAQRNRRLTGASPRSISSSSSSTFTESPVTPMTPDSIIIPPRTWSLLPVSEGKGLGFGPEVDLHQMSRTSTSSTGSALADYLNYTSLFDPIERSSISTPSFTSSATFEPSSSADYSTLQQAIPVTTSKVVQQKRIKRKAVPALDLSEISTFESIPSNSMSHPSLNSNTPSAASIQPTYYTFEVFPPLFEPPQIPLPPTPPSPATPSTPPSGISFARLTPPTTPANPKRSFYNNLKASISAFELTSSPASLSNEPSRRSLFKGHNRVPSSNGSDTGSSERTSVSSSRSSNSPVTPSVTAPERASRSIYQLEAGMRSFSMGKSTTNLSVFGESNTKVKAKKKPRGISRLFKRTALDVEGL